jgi:hypothetical protein
MVSFSTNLSGVNRNVLYTIYVVPDGSAIALLRKDPELKGGHCGKGFRLLKSLFKLLGVTGVTFAGYGMQLILLWGGKGPQELRDLEVLEPCIMFVVCLLEELVAKGWVEIIAVGMVESSASVLS